MEQQGIKAKLSEQQLLYCTLNGLRPALRSQVLMHDPKDLATIRRWALIAESSENRECITNILQRIEDKFSSLQVAATTQASKNAADASAQAKDTPSPDRRDTTRSGTPQRFTPQRQSFNNQTQFSNPPQFNHAQPYFQQQSQFNNPSQFNHTQPYFQQQSQFNNAAQLGDPSQFYSHAQWYDPNPPPQYCKWCGGPSHPKPACPANQTQCQYCKRIGHYTRVCLAARYGRRTQPQQQYANT